MRFTILEWNRHTKQDNEREEAMEQKRMIALEFLSVSRKKLDACESFEQRVIEGKMRLHYLRLALDYGCSLAECRMALGVSEMHLVELVKMCREYSSS